MLWVQLTISYLVILITNWVFFIIELEGFSVFKENVLIKANNIYYCWQKFVNLFFKGEYYNQEEVQAMVAAEVLEEERRKKEEADQLEAALQEMAMAKNKNRRKGPMVASWIHLAEMIPILVL